MIADAPFSSFDILTFQSVPDLESFQAHHGPVDICLMDVRMDDDHAHIDRKGNGQ